MAKHTGKIMHLTIRLDSPLLDDMRELAEINHRSLNGEMVVAILAYRDSMREKLDARDRPALASDRIASASDRIALASTVTEEIST